MTTTAQHTQATGRPRAFFPVTAGVIVLVLAAIGLLVGGPEVALGPMGGRALRRIPAPPPDVPSLLRFLGVGSVTWYACTVSIIPAWWLAHQFPLTQQRPWRALATQLGALIAFVFATTIVHYRVAYGGSTMAPGFREFLPVALAASALPLLVVLAIVNSIEGRRRAVRDLVESQRLRAELAESRLAAVTMQLQPHFLFNTLQSISTLIHRDPAAADAMLAKLSDLLRDVLRRSRSALVSLGDELRMTETYLDLARVRYADRLRIELVVEDGARGAVVPMLLLQPLVENALKHGVGRRAAGGTVGVTARVDEGRLLTVWDDGTGLDRGDAGREGTGLTNIRERLRHAFGDDQSLALRPRPAGGVEAIITMPLRVGGLEGS